MDAEVKNKILAIVLRIPGMLLIEMLYMEKVSLKNWSIFLDDFNNSPTWNIDLSLYILAWALVLLPLNVLWNMYCHITALLCLFLSHYSLYKFLQCDDKHIESPLDNENFPESSEYLPWFKCVLYKNEKYATTLVLLQLTLSLTSLFLLRLDWKKLPLFLLPSTPWITLLFRTDALMATLKFSYIITICSIVFYIAGKTSHVLGFINIKLRKIKFTIYRFGWIGLLEWAKDEYSIQYLLVTCWSLRYLVQFCANIYQKFDFDQFEQRVFTNLDLEIDDLSPNLFLFFLFFTTVGQCLTTTVNLFGLVCIVKDVVRFQYFIIRSWLHWSFSNHPPDTVSGPLTGAIDGVTLLIMTLYTDTLNVSLEARFTLLMYILLTIASSQFQSIFNIVDPILMTLATAHNGTFWKHLRTVVFALLLLFISGLLSYFSFFTMRSTFWVFIIAYNYVNTFSLILGSLSIYCVLMIDYITLRDWNQVDLDDVMFYIRGACRAVEFCVTLAMCGYIMMTFYVEMTSKAGIVMLAVYTYYCVVQRGGKGWKIWHMRRQASNKVRSLPIATQKELEQKMEDLCPICYQSMEINVRIMHCGHYFHEHCLKKWFYIQDKCPMCYAEFKNVVQTPARKTHLGAGDASNSNMAEK